MTGLVHLVEDDAAVRDALTQVLEGEKFEVRAFDSAEAYLASPGRSGCLLLDLALPGASGLELLRRLRERALALPTIFLTGHGDVPASVRAIKDGALDFLQKPVPKSVLLECIRNALDVDAKRGQARARFARLTPRERQLLPHVAGGRSSKEIARAIGISYRTVELHRGHIMEKTGARNPVDLAALCDAADLDQPGHLRR